jgi:geranylgeranyl diphosphate synthase type II
MSAWDDDLEARLEGDIAALWRRVGPGVDTDALQAALIEAAGGGKRVRPRLLADVHDSLGGRRPQAVLGVAAAIELLHTAFVIHDDLIDNDDLRRGRLSAPGRFRAAAEAMGATPRGTQVYATAGALLTGDLALSGALRALATLELPSPIRLRLVELVTEALATSATGELADVRLSLGTAATGYHDALELAYRKTAAYSFVLPMQAGAVLADAGAATIAILGDAGRDLGIAFQLYDDLAGMFADSDATGKDPLADLREGKPTMLLCHARSTEAWPEIKPRWGDPDLTVADLHAVRRLLEEAGTRLHVETVAAEHLQEGLRKAGHAGVGVLVADWADRLLRIHPEVAA